MTKKLGKFQKSRGATLGVIGVLIGIAGVMVYLIFFSDDPVIIAPAENNENIVQIS